MSLKNQGRTLIICSTFSLGEWENEIKDQCKQGVLSILVVRGTDKNTEVNELSKFDIVITTYEILVSDTSMYHVSSTHFFHPDISDIFNDNS